MELAQNKYKNFEVEENNTLIENLSYFESPSKNESDMNTFFFTRLSAFFEMGLLIKNNIICNMFYLGQNIEITNQSLYLKTPLSEPYKILTTNAETLLDKINFKNYLDVEKSTCLYIKICSDTGYILFSNLAEPWLSLRIESLQHSLMRMPLANEAL